MELLLKKDDLEIYLNGITVFYKRQGIEYDTKTMGKLQNILEILEENGIEITFKRRVK